MMLECLVNHKRYFEKITGGEGETNSCVVIQSPKVKNTSNTHTKTIASLLSSGTALKKLVN